MLKPLPSISSNRGFTLLEVITVVLIIGVIISFASLSVSNNDSKRVQDEAERLQHLLTLAAEESILRGKEMALFVCSARYQRKVGHYCR